MNTNEYLDMFLEESEEHIQSLSDEMMKFENDRNNLDIVATMFRSAHTLKGMSGTMGFEKMQRLTHTIENIMDDIRNGKKEVTDDIIDFMFKGIERLETLLNEIKENGSELSSIDDLLKTEKKNDSKAESKKTPGTISDLEKEMIYTAKKSGLNVFHIHFELIDECILKSVRVFMFFKELSNLGEVIKTFQEEDEIESENFNGKIDLIFSTHSAKEEIEQLINKLSEVKIIQVQEWEDENITGQSKENNAHQPTNAPIDAQREPKENHNQSKQGEMVPDKDQPSEKTEKKERNKHSVSIRVNLDKIDYLMGLFEEFIVEKGRLQNIAAKKKDKELTDSVENLSRISTDMQTALLSIRMVPLETIFNRFPRMVRATSKELGKNIHFIIEGAETELDRTVVEELGDPLVHLIRNSLDHGIESPEVRKQRGKNEQGTIRLKAYHKGNEAIIEIEDDGNGIDVDKVKAKILSKGLLTEEEVQLLSEDQIIQYIFGSGVSTAEKVTNLSGRGVGLDVVKSKIESLNGTVKVETQKGFGSKFTIVLPLTLSIIQALIVKEKHRTFAVPLVNVIETIAVQNDQIRELMGKKVLYYRNEIYNIHRFGELFNDEEISGKLYALIIKNSYQKYALLVNEIVGQQEIVLKPLKGYTEHTVGVTGATVLGDGSISFVFDTNYFRK